MARRGYGSPGYASYGPKLGKPFPAYPGTYNTAPPEPNDPFSGSYKGKSGRIVLDMEVDLDQIREFSPVLNILSGTLLDKAKSKKLWTGSSTAAHFRSQNNVKVVTFGEKHEAKCVVAVSLSNGNKLMGELTASFQKIKNEWQGKLLMLFGTKRCEFDIKRTSLFFREVNLDIDYTEEAVWPTVELQNLPNQPSAMKNRKLDPFSAFEDAGIKLHYRKEKGNKVADPTPATPWSKRDLYEVMLSHFDEVEEADSNIWCMMGITPPDEMYMGFSFDRKGKQGFALFIGHSTFKGHDSGDTKTRNMANRRLLHYLVHECGHCLGLAHPFEKGKPDSLSWMNYAWKYDKRHKPGNFYDTFEYRFSDQELVILRHSPGKNFKKEADSHTVRKTIEAPYGYASNPPDLKAADDSSDSDGESDEEGGSYSGKIKRGAYEKPKRKLELKLNMQNTSYTKGQLVTYDVRVKNVGRIAALIDRDLSVAGGNLRLYVTDQNGAAQTVDPYVRPIQSSYTKPRVLYTAEDDEGSDRYSEYGSIGEGKDGAIFDKVGVYTVKAQYTAGRYNVTSDSYSVEITEPEFDDIEEKETMSQISEMAELGGSSHDRFVKAKNFFENLYKEPPKKKKGNVAAMIALFDGMSKPTTRYVAGPSVGKQRKLTEKEPMRSPADLLKDTDDVIKLYHEEGKKSDSHPYSKLVLVRAELYLRENRVKDADMEINQLYGDLLGRQVKYDVLQDIRKKWQKMKNPKPAEEKQTSAYYQGKVAKVLDWNPRKYDNGEDDITGLGLGKSFSDFNDEHKKKGEIIYDMLKNQYEESQNFVSVMKYANGLQKGREANDRAVKYAVKGFILHTPEIRKLGVKYPEPPLKDPSYAQNAAMTELVRQGKPTEAWMNYWRCDADLNYHHSHWHGVYQGAGKPHLVRRGELFGYMHCQMLARYNAERETWGLEPVKPYIYGEEVDGFYAGYEFGNENSWCVRRVKGKLTRSNIRSLQPYEDEYKRAMEESYNCDANWAGAVLESAGEIPYGKKNIGSIHNSGHGNFSQMVSKIQGQRPRSTYMAYTETAIRDPIFYRWHKHIDDLWQLNNSRINTNLDENKAPIIITGKDIMITTSEKPRWESDHIEVLETLLIKPTKAYEHDDKLDHKKFYYHLKVKSTKKVKCTFRIFVCPERHANNRRRWIEMDKFVHTIDGETAITREDTHSSVIKRTHDMYNGAQEAEHVTMVQGWCECGLPYSMLLPRGTKEGERYMLCVIATDNETDSIKTRTSCGSMSFCGASDVEYPDKLQMGYPFTSNVMHGQPTDKTLLEVLEAQPNIALKKFVIRNVYSWRDMESPRMVHVALPPTPVESLPIWPNNSASEIVLTDGAYRTSRLKGKFQVILHEGDFDWSVGKATLRLAFSGRGIGNGEYTVQNAEIGLREKNTYRTDPSRMAPILVNGSTSFTIPEQGMTSDPVPLGLEGLGDYMISFSLESPGCYVKLDDSRTNTVRIKTVRGTQRGYSSIYCIKKIVL